MQIDRERLAKALWVAATDKSRADEYDRMMPIDQECYRRHVAAVLAEIEEQGFVIIHTDVVKAVRAWQQHEASSFWGTDAEKSRRASERGVKRLMRKAIGLIDAGKGEG